MTLEQSTTREKWPGRLFYVECPEDWTVLFGCELLILGEEEIFWDDLSKRRSFGVAAIQEEGENRLVVVREKNECLPLSGGTYTFQPVTLDLYETVIKKKMEWTESFEREEDVQVFILKKYYEGDS